MAEEQPPSMSIALRLRRVTIEDAYVAVPVTEALVRYDADGNGRLDGEAIMADGVRIGADPRVEWAVESATIEPHPVQQAAPDDRFALDPSTDGREG